MTEIIKGVESTTRIDIPEDCIKASKKFNEEDWRMLAFANEEISRRLSYGIREELAEKDGIRTSWSNGSRSWMGGRQKITKGTIVSMDADEMFLPMSPVRFERIHGCLGTLPLYFGSFEAKARGELLEAEATRIWAKGQLARIEREKGI